jgi:hypothetical protein
MGFPASKSSHSSQIITSELPKARHSHGGGKIAKAGTDEGGLERRTFNRHRQRRSISLFKHRTENRCALFGPMLYCMNRLPRPFRRERLK